jgi:hypothetical protein
LKEEYGKNLRTIKENGTWRTKYNSELHKLFIVKVVEVGWLRWLGQLFASQE